MTDTTLTTTNTPVIAPEAAAARLRLRGFLVRPHGIKWLVLQDGHPRRLTLSHGDMSLAAQIAQAAADRLSMDALAEQLYAETGETPPGTDQSTDPPNGWGYQPLLIRQIRRDGGTQARVGNNEDTVQEYADLMREKQWDFQTMQRPIVLYDGTDFWLADGFHRIEAAQRAGMTDYPVEVLRGSKRDAVLRAAGANATHGLRRTNADKRRAVELLLKDAEWAQWSDRKIADTCAVDHKTVADVRRSLGGEVPHLTTRQGTDGKSYPVAPARNPDPNPPNFPPALIAEAESLGIVLRAYEDGKKAFFHCPDGRIARGDARDLTQVIARLRPPADITDDEKRIAQTAGYIWEGSDLIPGKQAVYHFKSTGGVIDGATMTRPQFDAWLKIHTPIKRDPIPAPVQPLDADLITADDIRALADPLGLQMLWEDGRVLLYWPDEADDIEQMDLLSYGAALEWLKWEAKGIKLDRDEQAATAPASDPDHGASDRTAHLAKEARDAGRLERARSLLANGEYAAARTVLDGIEVSLRAADQLRATIPAGREITLRFDSDDCAALLRDAKAFEARGLTRDYPALSQALLLLLEAIKETK